MRLLLSLLSVALLVGCTTGAAERGSWPARILIENPDPAGFDDALAEANATLEAGEVIITADAAGCELSTAIAQPNGSQLDVAFNGDETACGRPSVYRAIFVLPRRGQNDNGAWDFTEHPIVKVTIRTP